MDAQTRTEYMEVVRDSWLTCRGPQRKFAKAYLDSYDRQVKAQRDKRNKKYIIWAVVILIVAGCLLP